MYLYAKIVFINVYLFLFTINSLINAQVGTEFPIEVTPDSCFALSFAHDETKYMITMRKENGFSGADIVIQFHSKNDHSLIGNPIKLGYTNYGSNDFDLAVTQSAFDGSRYLVVWTNGPQGGINYRFINAQNFELSSLFTDATLPITLGGLNVLHYNSNTSRYLLVSTIEGTSGGYYPIFNFIYPNGFISNSNSITNFAIRKEVSVAYGNGKYLVGFIKEDYQSSDSEVYGQLLDENGALIGSPFVIDGSSYPSDNPLFVIFDGTKFVCFFPDEEPEGWKIYAKKISLDGNVDPVRYLISTDGHLTPVATFASGKFLVNWTKIPTGPGVQGYVKGKFLDLNLNALVDDFVVFPALNGKYPIGGAVVFGDNKFYCYTSRIEFVPYGGQIVFTNGDVYGVPVIDPTSVDNMFLPLENYHLFQNYPNPFNPTTTIKFYLKEESNVLLKIYDLTGRIVTSLIKERLSAGVHSVSFNPEEHYLSDGVYFYQLIANDFISTKKMVFLK